MEITNCLPESLPFIPKGTGKEILLLGNAILLGILSEDINSYEQT